jgi:hypothetical protein
MSDPNPGLRKTLVLYKQDPLHMRQQNLWSRLMSLFERKVKDFLLIRRMPRNAYDQDEARSHWAAHIAELMDTYQEKAPPDDITSDAMHEVFRRLEADRKRQSRYRLSELPARIDGFRVFIYASESDVLFNLGCNRRIEPIHFYFLLAITKGLKISEAAELLCVHKRAAQKFVHKLLAELPKLVEGQPYQLPQMKGVKEEWLYRQTRYLFGEYNWLQNRRQRDKAVYEYRQQKKQAR